MVMCPSPPAAVADGPGLGRRAKRHDRGQMGSSRTTPSILTIRMACSSTSSYPKTPSAPIPPRRWPLCLHGHGRAWGPTVIPWAESGPPARRRFDQHKHWPNRGHPCVEQSAHQRHVVLRQPAPGQRPDHRALRRRPTATNAPTCTGTRMGSPRSNTMSIVPQVKTEPTPRSTNHLTTPFATATSQSRRPGLLLQSPPGRHATEVSSFTPASP